MVKSLRFGSLNLIGTEEVCCVLENKEGVGTSTTVKRNYLVSLLNSICSCITALAFNSEIVLISCVSIKGCDARLSTVVPPQ